MEINFHHQSLKPCTTSTSWDASGIINVYNTAQPLYSYHALSWDNANNGTLCYAEGDPSKWYMDDCGRSRSRETNRRGLEPQPYRHAA